MNPINIPGLSVVEKIGEGTQGSVFHARRNGQDYALKLYNAQSETETQRAIIEHLVAAGPPSQERPERFAWPLELIDLPNGAFGYLMPLIDTDRYISFRDVECGRVNHPGFEVMVKVCGEVSEAFREVGISGYCYGDISTNNFMFCPKTGKVVICDNDNIVVDQIGTSKVLGTPPYMAAEIVLRQTKPSAVTDQHSLSVLNFILMTGGNPLHGETEQNIRVFDGVASEHIYGKNPVFVFDPADDSNRLPDAEGYRHVGTNWSILPGPIKQLFMRAFTVGLKNPAKRVTAIEWMDAFTQLEGLLHVCSCGAENFWDPLRQDQQACWHRDCTIIFPPKLYIQGKTTHVLLVRSGQAITGSHLGEKTSSRVIGNMEPHPSETRQVLLRNKTPETWTAQRGDDRMDVPPEKAIPLYPGLSITASRHEFTVYP